MRRGNEGLGARGAEAVLSDDEATHRIRRFAGPSWQSEDGSKVVGKMIAKTPAAKADAIPWLLVAATSSGAGLLADVRFVQRYETGGGVAPAGPCRADQEVRVRYDAYYSFYR